MTTTITIEPAKAGNSLTDSCQSDVLAATQIPESAWDSEETKSRLPVQPSVDSSYVFDPDTTGEVVEYLYEGQGALLTGAPGAGKTSVVAQTCARQGIPLFQFTCSAESTLEQLVGHEGLVNGTTQFVPGPLAQACETASHIKGGMATKAVLLLDELDAASSAIVVGLNNFLEYHTITAADGRTLYGEGVTVFATANTSGAGDETGNWQTRQPIDPAVLNRLRNIPVDYMSAEAEAQVFARLCPDFGGRPDDSQDTFGMMLAKALADVRESWYNGELHQQPISTRQACGIVKRWSHTDGSTWWKAVRGCCLGSTRGSSRDALNDYHTIMESFGGVWPDSMKVVRDGFHKEVERVNDLLNK